MTAGLGALADRWALILGLVAPLVVLSGVLCKLMPIYFLLLLEKCLQCALRARWQASPLLGTNKSLALGGDCDRPPYTFKGRANPSIRMVF
uniref:Uncharacterized protein n=1 Tax=Arundo donax TaxID=35708 RepID=A0A0A8ZW01_ARUDO